MKNLGLLLILTVLPCSCIILSCGIGGAKASISYPVLDINTGLSYQGIQSAIDDSKTLNGNTIIVGKGTYYEHVMVSKSIVLVGENRDTTIVDGNGTGPVILVAANNVNITGFSVKNGEVGIRVDHYNNSVVSENDVLFNVDGIVVSYSNNSTIIQNNVRNSTQRGIFVTNSGNFVVKNNEVAFSQGSYGINSNASRSGLIFGNTAIGNYYDGIGVFDSAQCVVAGNSVSNSWLFGILVDSSNDSLVYHNNIVDNGIQASVSGLRNLWDDGAEGNYWSNHVGAGSYGVGFSPYVIDMNNIDYFPLTGLFRDFSTASGLDVAVISNSTIDSFAFIEPSTIRMHVSSMTSGQTQGFCKLTIPHSLVPPPYNITIDDHSVLYEVIYENSSFSIIYFGYAHSELVITIVPELAPFIMLPFLLIMALIVVVSRRRRRPD